MDIQHISLDCSLVGSDETLIVSNDDTSIILGVCVEGQPDFDHTYIKKNL